MTLVARYLPGKANVLADQLSCRGQVMGAEWSLHPEVAKQVFRLLGTQTLDLFATSLNKKFLLYCSLVPDPMGVMEDAFMHPWDGLEVYAFPPFCLIRRVLSRLILSRQCSMILVAPLWPPDPSSSVQTDVVPSVLDDPACSSQAPSGVVRRPVVTPGGAAPRPVSVASATEAAPLLHVPHVRPRVEPSRLEVVQHVVRAKGCGGIVPLC